VPNEEIGVCVAGAGRAGLIHARNFARAVPGARLAAVAEPDPDSLRAACRELDGVAGYARWEDAIAAPGVAAVVVAAPTAVHREIVTAAARAGRHILCEKPMGLRPDECDAMIDAAGRARVVLQIGFMRRFDPHFLEAKRHIDAGEIGGVVQVKSLTHGPSRPRPWHLDVARSNGPLAEVNSHDIDTLRWFTGGEFETVYAVAGNYRCPEARRDHPDFYDNVALVATFTTGAQGFVGGAMAVGYGYDARVEVVGTAGVLRVGEPADAPVVVCGCDGRGNGRCDKGWRERFAEAYRSEDADFIDCIRTGRAPRAGGLDGKRAVEVVAAGNRSIRERIPICVSPRPSTVPTDNMP
jgi:myo-inositol 2-dehydrogenase/D-chiro-inositol 1-dehydrogenase/scyllo-inositol 2-dehydrogenase (NAD+)